MKKIIFVILVIVLVLLAGAGGYWLGGKKTDLVQNSSIYLKPISGKPTIQELNSVSQDDITFLTGMSQEGRDSIAEVLDGIQQLTGMDFYRSYTNNEQLRWSRPANIAYYKWVSMNDQDKIEAIRSNWQSVDRYYIQYRMETVLATKDVDYSYDDAQKLFEEIRDYLITERGFTDGADDVGMGNPNAVLIKGNLICRIGFVPGSLGLTNINNEKIKQVKIEFGYYDEPTNN